MYVCVHARAHKYPAILAPIIISKRDCSSVERAAVTQRAESLRLNWVRVCCSVGRMLISQLAECFYSVSTVVTQPWVPSAALHSLDTGGTNLSVTLPLGG